MTITTLPSTPRRNNPSTFVLDAENFLDALSTFVTEANAGITSIPAKVSCKVATNVININLASVPTSIDSISLVTGDRVLLWHQTAPAENGIYEVINSTTWARAGDADTSAKLAGAIVSVQRGTYAGDVFTTKFKSTDNLGVTALYWIQNPFNSAASSNLGAAGSNIAIGNGALSSATTTSFSNFAFGASTLNNLIGGTGNIGIGSSTGRVTSGGASVTTPVNCIYIGNTINPANTTPSGETVIGNSLVGKGNNTTFIGGTQVYNGGNTTAWNTTSDQRLKKNILLNQQGVQVIDQIKIYNFEYKTADEITELPKETCINISGIQLGPIAQELPQEFVSTNETGVLSVNASNLIWYLVNAVKELNAQVKELENNT